MNAWRRGTAEIERLLTSGDLERRPAVELGATDLLSRADQLLNSARALLASDPVTSYVIAYDAARHAGTALLARQGLRATAKGGHVAVERALLAQFGTDFAAFRTLRRRRHELDYPTSADDFATDTEADAAITSAEAIVTRARHLITHEQLTRF